MNKPDEAARDELASLIDATINAEYSPGDDVMGSDLADALLPWIEERYAPKPRTDSQVMPEAAVDAAWDSLLERGRTGPLGIDYAGLAAALEAAAPHMAGYRWPLGDDDNPHRDGDVQPRGTAK